MTEGVNLWRSSERKQHGEAFASDSEKIDCRSVVGILQWLVTAQTRPDLAFEVNQRQKRIADLRVEDLLRANRAVKEAVRHRVKIQFRNIGLDAEVVTYHDTGLLNSVGVELGDREAEDVLLQGSAKKMVYSQKGVCFGLGCEGVISQSRRRGPSQLDTLEYQNKLLCRCPLLLRTLMLQ